MAETKSETSIFSTAMKFLRINKRTSPNPPQSHPFDFPLELLDRIIVHLQVHRFISDPYTTFDELKSLRLICKTFNYAIKPKVIKNVRLFVSDNPMSNMLQLWAMLCSNLNGHLYTTTTLVVGSWKRRYGKHMFISFNRMYELGLSRTFGIILNCTVIPLVYPLVILVRPHLLPLRIHDWVARLCTRYCLSHASALNMQNVRCVIWRLKAKDPEWMASDIVKLLLEFPQLSDLVLLIDYRRDLSHIFHCFSKLHNLRKLAVEILRVLVDGLHINQSNNPINDLGKVIGANPSLTHLELFLPFCTTTSCSAIFGHLPANTSPLKLEHLSISGRFTDFRATIPHIRSLTSIGFYGTHCNFMILQSGRIFPPFIQITYLKNDFLNYLRGHPRIVGLSIRYMCGQGASAVLEIMARHSESLTYFRAALDTLFYCLTIVENEPLLLQCTRLKQIVFMPCIHPERTSIMMVLNILPIIARLPNSLTLVFTNLPVIFKECVEHCSQSPDPLIHDLTKRITYKEIQQLQCESDGGFPRVGLFDDNFM